MQTKSKFVNILIELKNHAPFTLFGAVTGIIMMLAFRNISQQSSYKLFYIFHPTHVVLSAMVTASLFRLHEKKKNFLIVLLVGYFGSVGIATLSDSIIPFYGESILGVSVPSHADLHSETEPQKEHPSDKPERHEHHEHRFHIGFVEEWYIVNPSAILGVLIAYFLPRTKFPHALHILISTWASSAHIMMNLYNEITFLLVIGITIVLFIAVWLPCCFSDIVFPMLFVKSKTNISCTHH